MDMNKYNEWPANHKGDKNPSPKIIALGKRITDVAGHMIGGVTAEDPEYRLFPLPYLSERVYAARIVF